MRISIFIHKILKKIFLNEVWNSDLFHIVNQWIDFLIGNVILNISV